jgi:hypothetical protein
VPQCGKSSVASLLIARARRGTIVSFAAPLKEMVAVFLCNAGVDRYRLGHYSTDAKEAIIPEVGRSYRYLAQTMGTEWGRNCVGTDIWAQLTQTTIRRRLEEGCDLVVIDDMRFLNEARVIRELGGELWRVRNSAVEQRAAAEVLAHPSEGALADEAFDYTIANDGTWQELVATVRRAVDATAGVP